MATPAQIIDGRGSKSRAHVTAAGQLVTAPLKYDETEFRELAEPDTAYNFYPPKAGEQFVVRGIFAVADKQVSSVASATLIVYEASSITATTVDKVIFETAIVQDQIQPFMPSNIIVNKGKFVNAKTTDDDIHMTIFGYYIPALA